MRVRPLTTNIDTINVEGHAVNTVEGVLQSNAAADDTSTYQTGDTINGNGLTNVSLIVNANAALAVAAIADVNNVASVNVNLAKSATGDATVDMSEFDDVSQFAITQGSNSQFLDLDNAQVGTTYAINVARSVTLDIQSFEADTAAGTTVNLSLNGAGVNATRQTSTPTQAYSNTANVVFTGATTDIENINVATTGNNYVQLLETADLEVLTVTGSGTNTIVVGDAVADVLVDLSATTNAQTVDLLDNLSTGDQVTVLGGAGIDTVRGILAAGTTAATLTDVDAVGLTFANASSYFTATNAKTLQSVSIIDSTTGAALDASNEAATLTALSSTVGTLNIASTGTTGTVAGDNVTATYVSSSKGDLTVNVGASYDNVDIATLTVSNLTGELNINSIGKAANTNSIYSVTDSKATVVNVATAGSSIDITNDITAVAAAAFSLTATNGLTADVNAIEIGKTGKDISVATVELSATGLDSTGTTGSTAVTTVDAINIGVTDSVTVDLVTLVSDADGVVSFTATQVGAGDDVTVAIVDATGAAGDGVVIDLSDLDKNGSEVSTGAGSATVSLTQVDDTFTGGAGDVTVTTVGGADTINGGAGVETIVASTKDEAGGIIVNSFTAGKGGDIQGFDVTTVAADAWTGELTASGVAISAATVAAIDVHDTDTETNYTYTAGKNILVLEGVLANDTALAGELETQLYSATSAGASLLDDGNEILVAYYDGYSTQIREVTLVTVNSVTGEVTDVTVVGGGVEITGVNTDAVVSGNFVFA